MWHAAMAPVEGEMRMEAELVKGWGRGARGPEVEVGVADSNAMRVLWRSWQKTVRRVRQGRLRDSRAELRGMFVPAGARLEVAGAGVATCGPMLAHRPAGFVAIMGMSVAGAAPFVLGLAGTVVSSITWAGRVAERYAYCHRDLISFWVTGFRM